MQRAIDDRDVIINQGGQRTSRGMLRAFLWAVVAVAGLLALWLLIQTFDPQARSARVAAQWREEQLDSDLYRVDMLAGAVLRLTLPLALAVGTLGVVWVGLLLVYRRWAAVMSVQAHYHVKVIEAQRPYLPALATYSPHYTGHAASESIPPPSAPPALDAVPAPLPGVTDLATLHYRPNPQQVLLGLGVGGERIVVPMSKLWHVATSGPTGNGKSNIQRLLLGQLLALSAQVCIGAPKFTEYDREQDEDWRPIAHRLHLAPAVSPEQIGALLDFAVVTLQKRLELRRRQQRVGAPLFIALDELPWIYDHVKDADAQIAELVRLGRGVGVLVLAAAQDFLVKSTGLGAARDNFRSAFYLGGDLKTGSVLLDMPQRELSQREGELSLGIALLRSTATTPPALVRVPYVSNQSLYQMLGPVGALASASGGGGAAASYDNVTSAGTNAAPTSTPSEIELGTGHQDALDPRAYRVRELLRERKGVNEVLREVWSVDTTKKGGDYKAALAEYQSIVAHLLGGT